MPLRVVHRGVEQEVVLFRGANQRRPWRETKDNYGVMQVKEIHRTTASMCERRGGQI